MSINVFTMGSWFDEMLGDIKYTPNSKTGKEFPFFVRVGCVKRRPPRHEFFEMFLNVGQVHINKVMFHEEINESELSFVFPERWMGVAEQQAFMYVMTKHPEVKNIKSVDIITSSPLIVGNFLKDHIRILSWDNDTGLYNGAVED